MHGQKNIKLRFLGIKYEALKSGEFAGLHKKRNVCLRTLM